MPHALPYLTLPYRPCACPNETFRRLNRAVQHAKRSKFFNSNPKGLGDTSVVRLTFGSFYFKPN